MGLPMLVPEVQWHRLCLDGWPGWELDDRLPISVVLTLIKSVGPSSRDLADDFEGVAAGPFYYRDYTASGLPFVNPGEAYQSTFSFSKASDADRFRAAHVPPRPDVVVSAPTS